MSDSSCNCVVCALEFNPNESKNIHLAKINITKFKICESCLEISDPSDDFNEVRQIVKKYSGYSKQSSSISDRVKKLNTL